jgi:hypothetical protein
MPLDRLQEHLSDFRAEVFELAARASVSITAYLRSERGGDDGDEKKAETVELNTMLSDASSTPTLLALHPESKVQLLREDENTPLCRHCDTALNFRLVHSRRRCMSRTRIEVRVISYALDIYRRNVSLLPQKVPTPNPSQNPFPPI